MIYIKPLPRLEYLKECFELSEESPSGLVWKVRPREHFNTDRGWSRTNSQFANKSAGCAIFDPRNGRRHMGVRLGDKLYVAHRIVYSLSNAVTLSVSIEIDHRDRDSLNNGALNIRKASRFQNTRNSQTPKTNTTGVKGVSCDKRTGNYFGRVGYNGKRYSTGYSPSKEVIVELITELREKLHKDFCHHGK